MPTNREIYFNLFKENNRYLNRNVIKSLLNDANHFYNDIELYKNFDVKCKNYEYFSSNVDRVRSGEPYQYVLGYANFIDSIYEVNSNVLIPRQETEELVIQTKTYIEKFFKGQKVTIADVGTGSGCIPIALRRYFKDADIYASDISKEALAVAKRNGELHKSNITFFEGDMLAPYINNGIKLDVLVSNPPYIEDEITVDEQVLKYEPHLALFAKPNTKFYEIIFQNADKIMNPNCIMSFEIGEDMEETLSALVEHYFPTAAYKVAKDMYKKTRFLYIIRREDMNYA